MSKIGIGVRIVGNPDKGTVRVVDMRDEIITNATQFLQAIDRWRSNHVEKIGAIRLSPTQEYCLKCEHINSTFHIKENRPYTVEEIGPLKEFGGYTVFVNE